MDKYLPTELINEIQKFSNSETYIMSNLSCNKFNQSVKLRLKPYDKLYIPKSVKLLKWYMLYGFKIKSELFVNIPLYGVLQNIGWIEKNCMKLRKNMFNYLIDNSNLKYMKLLLKNGCPWNKWTFSLAVISGNLKNMKWLKKNGCIMNVLAFKYAALYDNLKIMKWLKKNNCPWNENVLGNAIKCANLKNIKWLIKNGCPWNYSLFSMALSLGNIKIVNWFKKNQLIQPHDIILHEPMDVVDFKTMKQFKEYKITYCPKCAFNNVAKHGNLKAIKRLKKNGFKYDTSTFSNALLSGNLKCIKWLRKNNCPFNVENIRFAHKNGNRKNINWLLKN